MPPPLYPCNIRLIVRNLGRLFGDRVGLPYTSLTLTRLFTILWDCWGSVFLHLYRCLVLDLLLEIFRDCPGAHSYTPDKNARLFTILWDCWGSVFLHLYTGGKFAFLLEIQGKFLEIVCPASDLEFPRPGPRRRLGPTPSRTTRRIVTSDPTVMPPTIGPHLPLPGHDTGGMTSQSSSTSDARKR